MSFLFTKNLGMTLIFRQYFSCCLILSGSNGKVGSCGVNGGSFEEFLYNLSWIFSNFPMCNSGLSPMKMGVNGPENDRK